MEKLTRMERVHKKSHMATELHIVKRKKETPDGRRQAEYNLLPQIELEKRHARKGREIILTDQKELILNRPAVYACGHFR